MTASKPNRYWMLITILLIVITVTGGIVAGLRCSPGQPVEISLPQAQELQGRIYIGGNVTASGFYPFTGRDSIEALIQAAGGITGSANLSELKLKLYILEMGEAQEPQKVDINRAEAWLLKALPGIGETLAQRIIDYRQENGPFRNIREIVKVVGIGTTTYEQIQDLITVAD
ncbi:helix-hairpin-helix domain-containing protein [Chloroflexota bacterium]